MLTVSPSADTASQVLISMSHFPTLVLIVLQAS